MSFRPLSLVSPTRALTEPTSPLPGCVSVQRTTPSIAGADAERVGEHDRRLDGAEFVHLRRARQLAEGVADEHGAGHLLLEHVAAVRHDGGDTRAHGVAGVQRDVADPHAGDVGDGVAGPRREDARRHTEIAGVRARLRRLSQQDGAPTTTDQQQSEPARADHDCAFYVLRRPARPIRVIRSAVVPMRHIPISAVEEAATAIYAAAVRTPLVRLDVPVRTPEGAAVEVYLKLECLQPIGSFKLRGAYNAVRQLSADELAGGVWTVSAGNAAQGVAFAARAVGAPCSVLVMDTAPETKVRAIERLGATIVRATYDECWRTVETHASERMHGHFVHPFDDDAFIAGNATAALEILEDLPDVSAVVAAIGGGGLLAGIGGRHRGPPARRARIRR